MEKISLNAQKRNTETKGQLRQLRETGFIPAILYGKKQQPIKLVVSEKELEEATATHAGFNALIDLNIAGEKPLIVLIRDYQAHPIHRNFTHVDFRAIDVTEKIIVEVPIELLGESIGVKEGGVMEQLLRKVEVRCLPTNIPESFEINVESLNIGDSVHTKGIALPEGVEFLKDTNYTIATVVPPTKEEEVVPTPEELAAAEAAAEGAPPAEGEAKPAEGAEAEKKEKAAEQKPEGEKKK